MRIEYLAGAYELENDGVRDFRWIKKNCEILFLENSETNYLLLDICSPVEKTINLTFHGIDYVKKIKSGWNKYVISIDTYVKAREKLVVTSDKLDIPNDDRELSLMIANVDFLNDADLPFVEYEEGFYDLENDSVRNFRWMESRGRIKIYGAKKEDWLLFEVGYPGKMPVDLHVEVLGREVKLNIINGWNQTGIPLDFLVKDEYEIIFLCDEISRSAGDPRSLSLMFGELRVAIPTEYEKNSAIFTREVFNRTCVESYPTFLTYETSARCNLHCAMCAVDESLNEFKHGREAGMNKTQPIYEEVLPFASKCQLHASGEVLMGKDFWKALSIAETHSKQHSLEIEIFSNGLLLNEEKRRAILSSPLTDLVVSVDAATAATYKRIRGGDFNLLEKNIKALVKENKEHGNKLRITLAFVMMRENIEELPAFVSLAKAWGVDTISYWPLFSTGIDMPAKVKGNFCFYYRQQMLMYYPHLTMKKIRETEKQAGIIGIRIGVTPCFNKDYTEFFKYEDIPYPLSKEDFDKYLASHDYFEEYKNEDVTGMELPEYKNCYLPWQEAFISTEGSFAPCLLLMYQGGIDNVLGKSFMQVWNSETMQSLREHIIKGKVHPLCGKAQCILVNKMF